MAQFALLEPAQMWELTLYVPIIIGYSHPVV
jgi:hypothetical protein